MIMTRSNIVWRGNLKELDRQDAQKRPGGTVLRTTWNYTYRLTQVHLEKWPLKRSVCMCVCTTSKHKMETLSLCSLGNAQTPRHTPPATADVASATLFIITRNLIAPYNLHNKFYSPPLSITVKQITQIRYASATHCLAIYCSGNTLVSINAVALHWARLVVGWVTAFGQVNCLTM